VDDPNTEGDFHMSISSVANNHTIPSSLSASSPDANKTAALSQLRQQFQQLGQDLQSGNLSSAQTDFATLRQASSAGTNTTTKSAPGNDPVTQALNQLRTDLQSGNLAGTPAKPAPGAPIAQQGFQGPGVHGHRHHHGPTAGPGGPAYPVSGQGFDLLGQALEANNLSAAQQAYNSVLQGLPLSLSSGLQATPDVLTQSAGSVSLDA
jgi:hypothetical protein